MTLGANQIGAYAADILDLEEQIEALQNGKRDLYKAIRDEHGRAEANSLKLAVKLHRMDGEKRDEAEAVDTEARRMLAIIEKGRAPRATRAREIIEQFPANTESQAEQEIVAPPAGFRADTPALSGDENRHINSEPGIKPVGGEVAQPPAAPIPKPGKGALGGSPSMASEPATGAGQTLQPAPVVPTAFDNARKIRPWCLHADDLTKCGGYGHVHCHECLKAHADDVGEAA